MKKVAMEQDAERLLADYLARHTPPLPPAGRSECFHFGYEEHADELLALVLSGVKTATCSLLWEYEAEREPLPVTGQIDIVTDASGRPACLIQTMDVDSAPFGEVSEDFARAEGEGDGSLAHWRRVHWGFFSKLCRQLGRTPSHSMPLVLQRFVLIHRAPSH